MPDIWIDVDAAVVLPVNKLPLIDDTDFKATEEAIAYDESGMDLVWTFVPCGGTPVQTVVTPTTAGDYDWAHTGNAMYSIEMTATGGASINNDTEGFGWFRGVCDGVLPWVSPIFGFRAAGLNNLLVESAHSAARGLAGTALPNAVADAAGGLPISDAGNLDLDTQLAHLNADIDSRSSHDAAGVLTAFAAWTPTAGAAATWQDITIATYAFIRGRINKDSDDYDYYDDDGDASGGTLLFGNRHAAGSRTPQ